jgi:hypothetical protein
MDDLETGSIDWVSGVMDWEGMPDGLEHIRPNEINDEKLAQLWEDATQEYQALQSILTKIYRYIESKLP